MKIVMEPIAKTMVQHFFKGKKHASYVVNLPVVDDITGDVYYSIRVRRFHDYICELFDPVVEEAEPFMEYVRKWDLDWTWKSLPDALPRGVRSAYQQELKKKNDEAGVVTATAEIMRKLFNAMDIDAKDAAEDPDAVTADAVRTHLGPILQQLVEDVAEAFGIGADAEPESS